MFDLSKIFNLSKKFALPDTLLKSKNYCIRKWSSLHVHCGPSMMSWSIYRSIYTLLLPKRGYIYRPKWEKGIYRPKLEKSIYRPRRDWRSTLYTKKINNFQIPCKTLFCLIHAWWMHHQNGNLEQSSRMKRKGITFS